MSRRGVFQIVCGRQAFRKVVLEPGRTVTFGRTDRAQVVIPDSAMSGLHFEITFGGADAVVRDVQSQGGTRVNGEAVPGGRLEHGGWVVAGGTTFQFFVEGWTPPTLEPPTATRVAAIVALRSRLGPPVLPSGRLYAVLDAARNERILMLLRESIDAYQSLYEGIKGRALDDVAPYLVRFAEGSDLLDRLLVGGWGNAWGIYLRSPEPMKEVRRHLRRFLMVEELPSVRRLYFRFYDPRVLRDFLPIASRRQRGELFGRFTRESNPVEAGTSVIETLLWESETADLVRENAVGEGRALVSHS